MLALVVVALLASATFSAPAGAMTPRPTASAERGQPRALFFGDSYFIGGGCSPDAKQGMAHLAGTRARLPPDRPGRRRHRLRRRQPRVRPPAVPRADPGRRPRPAQPGARRDRRRLQRPGAAGRPGEEERPEGPPHRCAQVPARAAGPGRAARPVRRLRRQHPDPRRAARGRQEAGRAVHRRHDLVRRPPRVAVRRLRAPDVRRPGELGEAAARRRSGSAAPETSPGASEPRLR